MSKPKKAKAKAKRIDTAAANARGPLPINTFIAIHQGKMDNLIADGYVVGDDLEFDFTNVDLGVVELRGKVTFGTKVELSVRKYLKATVRKGKECWSAKRYSYQCYIAGQSNSEIFRYDNYHEESPHDGHDGPHHVHRFDPPGSEQGGSPYEVKEEDKPFLDTVIKEAYQQSEQFKADNPDWATSIADQEAGERE